MCVAGGKRCDYADIISNVRKKARSKLETEGIDYGVELKVNMAVSEFQEKNPELVVAHLPEKWGFEHDIETKEIPEHIKEMLGDKKAPVAGCPEEDRAAFFQGLYDKHEEWKASLTKEEFGIAATYSIYSYEYMNAYLRRKGLSKWAKENPMFIEPYEDGLKGFIEDKAKPRIANLDAALDKAAEPKTPKKNLASFFRKKEEEKTPEPQKLYRFFRVPPGVTPEQFAAKYFEPGSGFKEKGYLSTSADPEYVASHIMDRSKGKKNRINKNYIVLEMVSNQGASLQTTPETEDSRIQTFEAEVLLPRGTTFQIVDTVKKKMVFGKDRKDIEKRYRNSDGSIHDFSAGKGINVPIIRMVDTKLL